MPSRKSSCLSVTNLPLTWSSVCYVQLCNCRGKCPERSIDEWLFAVSAGFDAAEGDELGECKVTPGAYAQMTHMLMGLAGGKVVVALEVRVALPSLSRPTLINRVTGRIQPRCHFEFG